jgi:hypothetical protein
VVFLSIRSYVHDNRLLQAIRLMRVLPDLRSMFDNCKQIVDHNGVSKHFYSPQADEVVLQKLDAHKPKHDVKALAHCFFINRRNHAMCVFDLARLCSKPCNCLAVLAFLPITCRT